MASTARPQTAPSPEQIHSIKKVFRQWDKDTSGVISRENLKEVMQEISALTERDIDRLMSEADSNKNGVIEYVEFVDWLNKPARESQARALLDYSDVLRPIFDALDRTSTGFIRYDEFQECHEILQAALRKHLEGEEETPEKTELRLSMSTPLQLKQEASVAFREVDEGGDGIITFHEFVDQMKPHLRTDRVRMDDLVQITESMAKMMKGVFRLKEMVKANGLQLPGEGNEETDRILEKLMDNLAKTTEKFEQALALDPPASATTNLWTEPPAGLNIESLKCTHMSFVPLSMRYVEDVTFEVFVVPSPEGQATPAKRRWIGELARKSKIKKNKRLHVESPCYYVYEPGKLMWEALPDSNEFNEALEKLPLELGVFCFLKTEANFGIELDWTAIITALRGAVSMDLITRNDLKQYESWMRFHVGVHMADQGWANDAHHVNDFLDRSVRLRPRLVMATLSELGVVKVSPVWKEFMQH